MHTSLISRALALLLSFVAATPGLSQLPPEASGTARAAPRRVRAGEWEIRWSSASDTTAAELRYPVAVAATSAHVFVVDGASGQIRRFDTGTGRAIADLGGRSTRVPGARELQTAPKGQLLTFSPDRTGVQLVDQRNGRTSEMSIGDKPIQSVCATDDGTVLALRGGQDGSILRVRSLGSVGAVMESPWPELLTLPSIARQATLTPIPGRNTCVLSLSLGGGMAIVSPTGVVARTNYVDNRRLPEAKVKVDSTPTGVQREEWLVKKTAAVIDVVADSTAIDVLYEDARASRGIWIDRYDATTGAYLESMAFPFRATMAAKVRGGYIVVLQRRGKFEVLSVAHRPKGK